MGSSFPRFAALGALLVFLSPGPLAAQIPERLKRCLPYPTLADELCELTGQNCKQSDEPSHEPDPRVFIDSVQLLGGDSLTSSVREEVLAAIQLKHGRPGLFVDDWLRELEEVGVRGALQNAGYFQAAVKAEGKILSSSGAEQHVALSIRIDEGRRYRLGWMKFTDARDSKPVFSFRALRQQIPLSDGDFFDVSQIRNGFDSLTRLYRKQGYVDFTAEPEMAMEERSDTINVTIVLSPDKQYRIGRVEVSGFEPATEKFLESQWKMGEIFNAEQVPAFFEQNKALLPKDASEKDLQVARNVKDGVVDLRFDFCCACPSSAN